MDKQTQERMVRDLPSLEDFLSLADSYKGKCNERLFKEVFLPWLTGDLADEDLPEGITPATWSRITGSPNNPVDIIDDNGNVLFELPPMMAMACVDVDNLNERPFSEMIADAKELDSKSPFQAQNIRKAMLNNIRFKEKSGELLEYKRRWAEVFLRYGVMVYDPNEDTTSTNNTSEDPLADLQSLIDGYE